MDQACTLTAFYRIDTACSITDNARKTDTMLTLGGHHLRFSNSSLGGSILVRLIYILWAGATDEGSAADAVFLRTQSSVGNNLFETENYDGEFYICICNQGQSHV